MDRKRAKLRIESLDFPIKLSSDDRNALADLYISGYQLGQEMASHPLSANQQSLLNKRLHAEPLDPKFLTALAEGDKSALQSVLYAGGRSGRQTDYSFEVYESDYQHRADEIAPDADDMRLLFSFFEKLSPEESDHALAELMFVMAAAVTDGVEAAIYEAAAQALQEQAQEELLEHEASASSVEETLDTMKSERPHMKSVVFDWKPDGDKIYLTLHLSKWQTKKVLEFLRHYFQ